MRIAYQNRKFSVFLSMTTQGGLGKLRQKLAEQVLAASHIPVSMDAWPSRSQPVRDVIEAELTQCDIFVTVVGGEYGTLCPEENVSYTELEFRIARKLQMPILAFVLDDPSFKASQRALRKKNPNAADAITRLRKEVSDGSNLTVTFYNQSETGDLAGAVRVAILGHAQRMRVGGWVREVEVREAIDLNETIRNNEFFRSFVERLKAFPILSQRAGDGRGAKEALASFFWQRYCSRLARMKFHSLYFESGSTLGYVGNEFLRLLLSRPSLRGSGALAPTIPPPKFRLFTNNILVDLDVVMAPFDSEPVEIERLPSGPADPYYGAIFGKLASLVDYLPEDFAGRLDSDAERLVGQLVQELKAKVGQGGFILMTASGLDTGKHEDCAGPHVGSYYNMLIKRSLIRTGLPIMMFLHATKILGGKAAFNPNRCFSVCDATGSHRWKNVLRRQPFGIVTACDGKESPVEVVKRLHDLGLKYVESSDPRLASESGRGPSVDTPAQQSWQTQPVVIIARNKKMKQMFDRQE